MSVAGVEALAMALGVALSPPPVIAMVLLLTTRRARSLGSAYFLGWLVGLLAIGLIVILVLDSTLPEDGAVPTWRAVLKLGLGAALLTLAGKSWRSRPVDGEAEPEPPGWMSRVDSLPVPGAFGLGLALTVANPKTLVMAGAGATTIAGADTTSARHLLAYLLFVVVASLGVGIPLVLAVAGGDAAAGVLARLKTWLVRHSAAMLTGVCLVIGGILVAQGLADLAG